MTKQQNFDDKKIKEEILGIVKKYGQLPIDFRFDADIFDLNKALSVEKTAKLLYDGKKDRRTILDKTISAPFQEIRRFSESKEKSEIEGEKNWYNKLIYGDNLQALKYLLDNGYKEKIKLIYIDPPFATKSDFSKGEVKAYRDKLEGAEFIEFIRERIILMKELLSPSGGIFIHLDDKKGHYIKVALDEIFTEANFRNNIIWAYRTGGASKEGGLPKKHDNILFYSKTKDLDFKGLQERIYYEKNFFGGQIDENGRPFADVLVRDVIEDIIYLKENGKITEKNVKPLLNLSRERKDYDYPTMKPPTLLEILFKTLINNRSEIAPKRELTTQRRYVSSLNNLRPYFCGMLLSDITSKTVSAYYQKRKEEGAAIATVNREFDLISKAFNLAWKQWEWCKENPCQKVQREPENNMIVR